MRIVDPYESSVGWRARAVTFGVVLTLATAVSGCNRASTARPNIVVIVADDHRPDIMSAAGNEHIETPHLDRLADEGTRFTEAFTTSGMCAPARAALLTGKHAHATGVPIHLSRCHTFRMRETPFPARLQAAGYVTAHLGKWHLGGDHSPRAGYDHWLGTPRFAYRDAQWHRDGERVTTPPGTWTDTFLADEATALIARYAQGSDARPFALFLGLRAPHVPFEALPEHRAAMASADIPTPVGFERVHPDPDGVFSIRGRAAMGLFGGSWPDFIRAYYASALGLDQTVGRLMAALEAHGVADDTVVIYTSDQGLAIGERGETGKLHGHDQTMRIPLVVRYPRRVARHAVRDELALITDIAPTVLELAGLEPPADMHGRSLVPLLERSADRDVDPPWRDDFFFEYWFYEIDNRRAQVAVRTRDHKLIHDQYRGRRWRELYDLATDPFEMENRIDDPAYGEVLTDLEQRLAAQQEALDWRSSVRYRPHGFFVLGPLPADAPDLFQRWGTEPVDFDAPVTIGGVEHRWRPRARRNRSPTYVDLDTLVSAEKGEILYLGTLIERKTASPTSTLLRTKNETGFLEALSVTGDAWRARATSERTWSEYVLDVPLHEEQTPLVLRVRVGETASRLGIRFIAPNDHLMVPQIGYWEDAESRAAAASP